MPINKLKPLLALVVVLLLSGCSGTNNYGATIPYDAWRLGLFAPNYMEVWIETADAVDINNRWFKRAMSGVPSIQTPPNLSGNPKGWPKRVGDAKGKHVYGANLPRLIYVRWQSLAEPQTYEAYIEIPENTRQAMLEGGKTYCKVTKEWITDYRENVVIGLAPGGIAKTWIRGTCLDPIEVNRVQGAIVKKGPSQGQNKGRYALKLEPESQAYIEKYGIPYESW